MQCLIMNEERVYFMSLVSYYIHILLYLLTFGIHIDSHSTEYKETIKQATSEKN